MKLDNVCMIVNIEVISDSISNYWRIRVSKSLTTCVKMTEEVYANRHHTLETDVEENGLTKVITFIYAV